MTKPRKKTFGKRDMVDELFVYLRKQGITVSRADVNKLYDEIFHIIADRAKAGYVVTLGVIGSLASHAPAPRKGYIPSTGQPVEIPSKNRPKLKPSSKFKTLLNK